MRFFSSPDWEAKILRMVIPFSMVRFGKWRAWWEELLDEPVDFKGVLLYAFSSFLKKVFMQKVRGKYEIERRYPWPLKLGLNTSLPLKGLVPTCINSAKELKM
jgi:hypothetical protein